MMESKKLIKKSIFIVVGIIALFFVLALFQRREIPLRIEHIDFKNIADNRLRFKVDVRTTEKCNVVLQYWRKEGGDTLYSTVSKHNVNHELWIVNVKEQSNYQFRVISYNAYEKSKSKIYNFASNAIYQATPFLSLDYVDSTFANEVQGKYFLTQKLDQPGAVIMLDHQGDIVWYESFKKGVRVSHWTKHKTVLCILGDDSIPFSGGDEIVEVALSGEIITHLVRGKGDMDKVVHHDVQFDEQDNIYALTFDWRIFDLSSVGGSKQDSILGDGIVVFNKKGDKVWEWSLFDHIDPLKDPKILQDRRDWLHANSLSKDVDGNFLISFRDLNQIWKIDAKTGTVKWKFGKDGYFELPPQYFFSGQHGTHISHKGELLMLDNGLKTKTTRVLSFQLDTLNMTAVPSTEITMPKEYFSIPKGSAYMFSDDKYLLCLSQPRVLLIVDSKGKVLWKVVMGGDPYRVELVENLNEPPLI
jgi:outer membrane protein assembly factor BamB